MIILIIIVYYMINSISKFIFIILEYILNISKVNISLLNFIILLITFIIICNIMFLSIRTFLNFFRKILYIYLSEV